MNKSTTKAVADLTDLASAIQAAHQAAAGSEILPSRPEGGFTAAEYCHKLGLTQAAGGGHLRRLVERGEYEVVVAYHRNARNFLTPTNFYRPKSK